MILNIRTNRCIRKSYNNITLSKLATLETGAVVKVPLFLNTGEVIKVDTRSAEYISRVR